MNICLAVYCKKEEFRPLARRLANAVRFDLDRGGVHDVSNSILYQKDDVLIFNSRSLLNLWKVDSHHSDKSGVTSCSALPLPVDEEVTPEDYYKKVNARLDRGRSIDTLNAPFFAARHSGGTLKIYSDPLGIGRAYYIENDFFFAASNSLAACRMFDPDPIEVDTQAWRLFSAFGWFTGEDTPLKKTKRIPPATIFTLPGTQRTYFEPNELIRHRVPDPNQIEIAQSQMLTLCRNVAALSYSKPTLLLSGGRDSRVTCAAWIATGTPATVTTYGALKAEADVAKRLMAAVEGPFIHQVKEPTREGNNETDYLTRFDLAAAKWDGDAPPIKAMTITAQRYQPKAPIFGGGGGEIAHGNYYPNDDILREVKESSSPIDRLIAYFSRGIGCHPDAPELVSHRLHQLQEVIRATGIDGPTILDAFYLKERFRRWVAAGHETHSVLLFACPGFVRLAFDATPEERRATKIHKALSNLFVPGWGDVPFYKAKVRDTDERAEKGLRIWQGSDREAVLAAIRDSSSYADVISSEAMAWTVVDILSGKSQGRYDSAFQRVLWYRAFKKRTANMSRLHQRRWESHVTASPLGSG